MNEISDKFFEDMADDFFAECDELLALIKQRMLTIDQLRGKEHVPRPVMEDLLRSCHTMKGLTGMIGAEELMRFIHTIETYLKSVYTGDSVIPEKAIDILFKSVNLIEKQVDALRNKEAIPESLSMISEIESLITDVNRVNELIQEFPQESSQETQWKFTFTPSALLFEKGININEIRSILQKTGRILSSVPTTDEGGRISFVFLVTTDKSEAEFSKSMPEGVSYEAVNDKPVPMDDPSKTSQSIVQKNVVRVDLSRLEDIMRTIGDLVISRSRLQDQIQHFDQSNAFQQVTSLQDLNNMMERQIRELRESVMKLRLIPTGEVFERMRFVVRDLIRESGKSITIDFSGWETMIDKSVMERISDPLLHLVRNAVSHGIEPKEDRITAGKPAEGKLSLRSSALGSSVFFEVEDDGKGIDRDRVREKALRLNLIKPDDVTNDAIILDLICMPGFSTKEKSDLVSGRGIGMDVVKSAVRELGGSMEMQSEKGRGTKFILQLPLTLTIVDALIVKVGNHILAVPLPVVNEVIRISAVDMVKVDEYEIINYRDAVIPIYRLEDHFNLKRREEGSFDVIVTGTGHSRTGITVDKILGQREIVIRSLNDPLVKVEGISGATELGEGKIVLILDIPALIRSAGKNKRSLIKTAQTT